MADVLRPDPAPPLDATPANSPKKLTAIVETALNVGYVVTIQPEGKQNGMTLIQTGTPLQVTLAEFPARQETMSADLHATNSEDGHDAQAA